MKKEEKKNNRKKGTEKREQEIQEKKPKNQKKRMKNRKNKKRTLTCPPEVGAIEAISAIQKMAHPNPTNVTKYIQIIAGSPPLGRT